MVEIVDARVIISIMMLGNANDVVRYDRRRSGLPSAPLDMEYNNNITKQYPQP